MCFRRAHERKMPNVRLVLRFLMHSPIPFDSTRCPGIQAPEIPRLKNGVVKQEFTIFHF